MKKYTRALTIAGFDGSGGAGIQADLKVFSALGCYGMTVLTAMPIQNTQGVSKLYEIPVSSVGEQIYANLSDIGADVIKIGMVYSVEIIEVIIESLKEFMPMRIVLDPVMIAKSGDRLLSKDAIGSLRDKLLPLVDVVTPNLLEASEFLGRTIRTRKEMERAGRDLVELGCKAVVVKGGHSDDVLAGDCLVEKSGEVRWFESERIETRNTHGTGCSFSAAIAAYLAKGVSMGDAVSLAKSYIDEAIRGGSSFSIGKGNGPVHHFCRIWED